MVASGNKPNVSQPPKEEEASAKERRSFDWESVHKDPRSRQKYLGNSVKAPLVRGTKDPFWWSRDTSKVTKAFTGKSSRSGTTSIFTEELKREQQELKEKEAKLLEFYLAKGMGAKAPEDLLQGATGNKKNFRRELKQRQEHYPLEFDDLGKKGGRSGGYN